MKMEFPCIYAKVLSNENEPKPFPLVIAINLFYIRRLLRFGGTVMLRRCSQQCEVALCGQSWWCWACEDKDDCWQRTVNARLWQLNLVLRFEICLDSEKDRIRQKAWFNQSRSSKLPKPPYMPGLAFEKMWVQLTTHMDENLSSTFVRMYLFSRAKRSIHSITKEEEGMMRCQLDLVRGTG